MNNNQYKILKECGVKVWNELRKQYPSIKVDLRYADFTDADLRDADLTNADLRYADLTDADLRCADLTNADLRCADLTNADLRCADLTNADLRCADLRGVDLTGADLTGADLTGADLRSDKYKYKFELLNDFLIKNNIKISIKYSSVRYPIFVIIIDDVEYILKDEYEEFLPISNRKD